MPILKRFQSNRARHVTAVVCIASCALFMLWLDASFINDQVESATQSVKVNQLIPQFIHQSWKTHTVPEKFNSWDQTWKHQNPDYNYILWNDQENEDLIRKEYPWFLDTYLSYSHPICRADAARVFYLHRFGGVYVDLDIAAYKPLEGLLGEHQLVLAQMQTERRHAKHGIPNGFMASKPGHGFWMHCARKMMLLVAANQTKVELLTGPIMLWDALDEYLRTNASQVETIFIADSKLVFPFSWSSSDEATKAVCFKYRMDTFNEHKCRRRVDPKRRAYAISYSAWSWNPK